MLIVGCLANPTWLTAAIFKIAMTTRRCIVLTTIWQRTLLSLAECSTYYCFDTRRLVFGIN